MDGQTDVSIVYLIEVSCEARCTTFCSDMLMKSSSCSYFPGSVVSIYLSRLSSIQLISLRLHAAC